MDWEQTIKMLFALAILGFGLYTQWPRRKTNQQIKEEINRL
ncbi:hypothetical protein [Leptospira fletcheri]|nr:hypothetical protein [Leptospira fletcheri]